MTTIDRNPDIQMETESVPEGMQLIRGKNLMHTARGYKIPFGVATLVSDGSYRKETLGLIIRDEHVEAFKAAIRLKEKRLAHNAEKLASKKSNCQTVTF